MVGCQFDQHIDRRNTQCLKWDGVLETFGADSLIPMWVADMDFRPPEAVVQAVTKRAAHGIYGYESRPCQYLAVVLQWLKTRHNWTVEPTWVKHSPGVVPGLALAISALTDPGDRIVIQPPVYPPFYRVIQENNRTVVENSLIQRDGQFSMNFEELEEIFCSGARMMILCSPHNPVGRVWSRAELSQLAELAIRYHVTILSDEIWADLAFKSHIHTPLASLSPAMANQTLTFMAPSKTFNLAGFYLSNVIIPNEQFQLKFCSQIQRLGLGHLSFFGLVASEAAYREGGEWLDSLLAYLEESAQYVIDELAKITPKIKVIKPQGTFLLWLDCRELGIAPEKLNQFFVREAGIAFNDGIVFGPAGYGFQRMNIGCPRSMIKEALERLAKALKTI